MPNDRHEPELAECRRVAILEARRRGLSVDDADDIAQEVCIRLLLLLDAGKSVQHIPAWTRKTTANLVIDTHRKDRAAKYGGGLLESLTDYDDELNRCT